MKVSKISKYSYSWAQCGKIFKLVQKLRFHLQNIHYIEFIKRLKRFNIEYETDFKFFKVKRVNSVNPYGSDMKTDIYYKQEFKFINKTMKLWNLKIYIQSISFLIGSSDSISMPDWIMNRNENTVKMSSSSVYIDIIKNIDYLLLVSIITSDISDQTTIYDFINGDDSIGINEEKCHLSEIEFPVKDATVIQSICQ